MLRASAHATGQPIDLRAITDRAPDAELGASGELLAFTTALVRDDERLEAQRAALGTAAGPHARPASGSSPRANRSPNSRRRSTDSAGMSGRWAARVDLIRS